MTRLKLSDSEDDIKKLVLKWFKQHNGWSFAPVSRGMGVHGIPDRVGCIPIVITQEMVGKIIGLFVGIEAKKPGRRSEKNAGASGLQISQITGIIDAGGIGCLVDSELDMDLLSGIKFNLQYTLDNWKDFVTNILRRRLGNG